MGDRANGNWIGGERRAAADGDRFVLRAPGGGEVLGNWPRSRLPELTGALEAARGAAAWGRATPAERRRVLEGAAAALVDEPDPRGIGAGALGWTRAELRAHLEPLQRRRASDAKPWGETGPILCAPHWSELFGGLADVLEVLETGRSVCLLAPFPLAGLADRLAEALLEAGLPPGALGVLHDDGPGAWRCALELASLGVWGGISCSGTGQPPRLGRQPAALPLEASGGPQAALAAPLPFGAGVVPARRPRVSFRGLRPRTACVEPDDDLRRAARDVVEAALGRSVLGGQLPGQIGLVACDPLAFSRFTAAVLEALEGPEAPGGQLYEDPEIARELARSRDLGLDEGAVLIHEREPMGGAGRAWGSPSGPPGGSLGRLVFTNVESTMRLAGLTRPAPMLLLMRGEAQAPRAPARC